MWRARARSFPSRIVRMQPSMYRFVHSGLYRTGHPKGNRPFLIEPLQSIQPLLMLTPLQPNSRRLCSTYHGQYQHATKIAHTKITAMVIIPAFRRFMIGTFSVSCGVARRVIDALPRPHECHPNVSVPLKLSYLPLKLESISVVANTDHRIGSPTQVSMISAHCSLVGVHDTVGTTSSGIVTSVLPLTSI